MTESTAPEVTATEADGPSLGIADIQNALRIIDYAAEQGTFKGWNTMQQVFSVRQRLDAFVQFAKANSPEEVQGEEQAS